MNPWQLLPRVLLMISVPGVQRQAKRIRLVQTKCMKVNIRFILFVGTYRIMKHSTLIWSALILMMATVIGCASTSTLVRDPGRLIGKPRAEQNVSRVLCLWEASRGTGVDGKPARGFAGQILFFGGGHDAAVQVDGDVRIIEYDAYSSDDDDPVPLHTFTFKADAWDVHRTEGSLGHSYSVFIPYMQKHKDTVNCGLKVEFVGSNGRVTASDTTEVLLPGRGAQASTSPLQRSVIRNSSRRIGPNKNHEAQSNVVSEKDASKLETTTIALPVR